MQRRTEVIQVAPDNITPSGRPHDLEQKAHGTRATPAEISTEPLPQLTSFYPRVLQHSAPEWHELIVTVAAAQKGKKVVLSRFDAAQTPGGALESTADNTGSVYRAVGEHFAQWRAELELAGALRATAAGADRTAMVRIAAAVSDQS